MTISDNFKQTLWAHPIKSIEGLIEGSTCIIITLANGQHIVQSHDQDCCEIVEVTQVDGNVDKFIGSIAHELIERVVRYDAEAPDATLFGDPDWMESATATFYTLKTSAGYLDWRWTGESNGYYSESVDCKLITPKCVQ